MKLLLAILLSGLLVLATTAFSQEANVPVPEKGRPALSEVQGHGFGGPAFQRGPQHSEFCGPPMDGPRGPMFRGGPMGGPRGPRGPMMGQGRGPQGQGCCCPCHKQHGKKQGKQQRQGRR